MVIVEIKEGALCLKQDAGGKCLESKIVCKISESEKPILLPDYSKPFFDQASGRFWKTDVELNIADGWRLDSVKDKSDNSAVLGNVIKRSQILQSC